ncbi:MAG: nucleotide-binding domain containing protein, partial [Peptostreptococcaceae bacterium]
DNIKNSKDTIIYTTRKLVKGSNGRESLDIGNKISNGLVKIIKRLGTTPKYVVAKGGITSSDIATKAIKIEKAIVEGQIIAGVPVWKAIKSKKFEQIKYIVFPGNVGDEKALTDLYNKLI